MRVVEGISLLLWCCLMAGCSCGRTSPNSGNHRSAAGGEGASAGSPALGGAGGNQPTDGGAPDSNPTQGGASDGGQGGDSAVSCAGPVVVVSDARACDILLRVGDEPVASVAFSSETRGAYLQRPPRLAISIITAEDVPFEVNAVCLEGEVSEVTLTEATCYDRLGWPVESGSVELP